MLYLFLYPGLGTFAGYLGWSQETQYEQEIEQANERYGPIYEQHVNTPIESLIDNEQAVQIGAAVQGVFEHHADAEPTFTLLQWQLA